MARRKEEMEDAARWVREYVVAHPDASVDDVARAANNANRGLNRREIASIRLAVRSVGASRVSVGKPREGATVHRDPFCHLCKSAGHWPSQCPSPPFIQPKLDEPGDQGVAAMLMHTMNEGMKEESMQSAEEAEARKKSPAGMKVRRRVVNELLDGDPSLHPTVILGKLKGRFGIALDGGYVYESCRLAREIAGIEQLGEADNPSRAEHQRPGLVVSVEPAEVPRPVYAGDLETTLSNIRNLVLRLHGEHSGLEVHLELLSNGHCEVRYSVTKSGIIK